MFSFLLYSSCLWFSKFWPWIFNADLLGLPKTAPVVIRFSDLSAEVTTWDCCSKFIMKARSLLRGEQQYALSLHPHALTKSPLVGSCLTQNGKRTCQYAKGTLRKDIFKDWPFTCTYCSIVLCFDVRSTWEKSEIWKLDRSFCMIKVELFLYVSVMHVYLSFLFCLFVL